MASRTVRIVGIFLAALALLVLAVGLGLLPLNLFFAKDAISRSIHEETGWQLTVDGPLSLRLGLRPTLITGQIYLSLAGSEGDLILSATSLRVRTRLSSTLRREIDLLELRISDLSSEPCPFASCPPEIWPGPIQVVAEARLGKAARMELTGAIDGGPVSLELIADDLQRLLGDSEHLPVQLTFRGPGVSLDAEGAMGRPLSAPHLSARAGLELENLAATLARFGIEWSGSSPLAAEAAIEADSTALRLEDLEVRWESSRLTGAAAIQNGPERPRVQIEARLDQLDFATLPAGREDSEAEWRLDTPIVDRLAPFGRVDGDFRLSITRLSGLPLEVGELEIRAQLDGGQMIVERLDLLLADRPLRASGHFRTAGECPQTDLALGWDRADSAVFDAWLAEATDWRGSADRVELEWVSCGQTIGAHRDSASLHARFGGLVFRDGEESLPLVFESTELQATWLSDVLLSFRGSSEDTEVTGQLEFGSPEAMVSGSSWGFSGDAEAAGLRVAALGTATPGPDGLRFSARLAASSDRFALAPDAPSRIPMKLEAEVEVAPNFISAEDLVLQLGHSDVSGRLRFGENGADRHLDLQLQSGRLDLGEGASLFSPGKSAGSATDQPGAAWHARDWLDRWLGFPPVDIDWTVESMHGLNVDVSQAHLEAGLRNRLVRDGHLAMKLEDIAIDGVTQLDFRQSPGVASFEFQLDNIDVGRLLSQLGWIDGVRLHAGHVDASLSASGDSLLELARQLEFRSTIDEFEWSFDLGPEKTPNHLFLSRVEVSQASDRTVAWRTRGELNQAPVEVFLQTPPLHDLFDRSRPLPLRLAIQANEEAGLLDLTVDQRTGDGGHARFSLSGEYHTPDSPDISELEPPLGLWQLYGDMTVQPDRLTFKPIDLTVGSSRVHGDLDLKYENQRYHFTAELDSPMIETDDLVKWAEDLRVGRRLLRQAEQPDVALSREEASILRLIGDQFRQWTEKTDLHIDARVQELRSGGQLLGQSELSGRFEDEVLDVDLEVRLDDGDVSAKYLSRPLDGNYENLLDVRIDRLPYGGILRLFDREAEARGQLYLDTRLVARAEREDELVDNTNGHFDLVVIPEDVNAAFLDLWASNLVFALLPVGDDSRKKLNCMVARFEVEDGVMRSRNTFLDSTEVIVRARGDIDLARKQLDLWLAPQAKLERFLSVQTPITVTGPFNDYEIALEPGGFLTTLLRWYYGLIYVPWKWLTGERFPPDGIVTCFNAMDWPIPERY